MRDTNVIEPACNDKVMRDAAHHQLKASWQLFANRLTV